MILNNYKLREDLAEVLEQYERDKNISPILIVENLLEKFLYDEKYIIVDTEAEVVKTPKEIYSERKSRFRVMQMSRCCRLYYDVYDFGCFKKDELEEIMDKLLDFSDDELAELDYNNWEYSKNKYKPFIRQKLENPLLTPEEFFNKARVKIFHSESKNSIGFKFKGQLIAQFNRDSYPRAIVDEVYEVVCNWSDEEIQEFINKRKSSDSELISAEFIIKEIKESGFRGKKYCVCKDNGKVSIVKGGRNFGTHSPDKVDAVWEFLNAHNWDKKYSTKAVGLRGNEYLNWLYLQIGIIGDD